MSDAQHMCIGCHYRWEGEGGAMLCGDCWRRGQAAILGIVPTLDEAVRGAIMAALAAGGNQREAARLLGISPRVLNYRMRRMGIPRPRDRRADGNR